MSGMIDRCVRAILDDEKIIYEFDKLKPDTVESIVRKVIEAMREPTNNMLLKGKNPIDAETFKFAQISITPELMNTSWKTMIDEALK